MEKSAIVAKKKIKGYIRRHLPSAEPYEGSYNVIPSDISQKLLTSNKLLLDDITIEPIPYAEELNESGGITIKIG